MKASTWWATVPAALSLLLAAFALRSAAAGQPTPALTRPAAHTRVVRAYVTFYGWYDNTPPGCGTAYGGCAGGTGTYQNPITFATDKAELPVGTILYYPALHKYFKMGDACAECTQDWSNPHGGPDGGPGLYHVDLWLGGKGGNEFNAVNCENALTQGTSSGAPLLTRVIVNPPPNQPVSTGPIFSSRTGHCFGGAAASTSFGRYASGASRQCLADPGDSTVPGTQVTVAACSSAPAENLAFNGAFLTISKLCLNAVMGVNRPGSTLDLASCNGGPAQQWSINSSGTISAIQTGLCIRQSGTSVVTATCTTAASEKWAYTPERAP